jgi:ABC-type multidrug transport system fused ATPase/permease subunit/CRP-like cAMP-binding protein
MTTHVPANDEASTTRVDGTFSSLMRWYWPYVRPFRVRLAWVFGGLAIVLACQAFIPLTVEGILHHGEWDLPALSLLLAMIVIQLTVGHFAHIGGHYVASTSATLLRLRIFDRTLHSRVLRQEGLVRSSVVSRHTIDVDHVSEAFDKTVNYGIPGVLRVIISLGLLTFIEWQAGVVMTIASLLFVLLRMWTGKSLVIADRDRLGASSRVGESVDEALTAPRSIAGLHLGNWIEGRFSRRSYALEEASHRQGRKIADLVTGAHAAGLAGLLAVVVFALVMGGAGLAGVAAALLYVEGVVKGLEALPTWVRAVQLAMVSRHRIDHILVDADRIDLTEAAFPSFFNIPPGALDFPDHSMVGIVTPVALETDVPLTLLSGQQLPEAWRVTLDGHPVRAHGVNIDTLHVPAEPLAFNSSVFDHFGALVPDLAESKILKLLSDVGLDYLAGMPDGLSRPIGPVGNHLTVNERQRLALAMAMATQSRLLLVGPILALADTDTALPLIEALRERNFPAVIVTARTAEVAASMDLMIFATADGMRMDTHEQLLVDSPEYSQLWSSRLSSADVDLSVLGIDESSQGTLLTRLVTERYSAGDIIYREGAPADRIIFTISGKIEIVASDAFGRDRRVAVLGPGNHCGDLRLTPGEVRAETAIALEDCIVRSLSREAISAGMSGLLDRTPAERRIVASILREGASTLDELHDRLPDIEPALIGSSIALLKQDGALREDQGRYSAVQKRAVKSGAAAILDRLG